MQRVTFPKYSHVTNSKTLNITREYDARYWEKNADLLNRNGKPLGLWYSFGSQWFDLIKGEGMTTKYGKHVFSLKFKPNCRVSPRTRLTPMTMGRKIVVLKTPADVLLFHKKFVMKPRVKNSVLTIDWGKVWQQYAGIEVVNYRKLMHPGGKLYDTLVMKQKHFWIGGLDIDCGCVWRPADVLSGYEKKLTWVPRKGYKRV